MFRSVVGGNGARKQARSSSRLASPMSSPEKREVASDGDLLVVRSFQLPPARLEDPHKEQSKELQTLKAKYAALLKSSEQLRSELKEKKARLTELEADVTAEKFKRVSPPGVSNASFDHASCEKELSQVKKQLTQKLALCRSLETQMRTEKQQHENEVVRLKSEHADILSCMKKQHGEDMQSSRRELETELAGLKRHFDDLIAEKDSKLSSLKAQMAGSFADNARERQQQIDELLKELQRVSDEAEYVKGALKNVTTSNVVCTRCVYLEQKVVALTGELNNKRSTCDDLLKLCGKMETQLSQQDELLAIWKRIKQENQHVTRT